MYFDDEGEHKPVYCPACGTQMNLKYSPKYQKLYYVCPRYPKCRQTHTAHPDGTPVGKPAVKRVRDLRREVHDTASRIWDWKNFHQRQKMYAWLNKNTSTGHIGSLFYDELIEVHKKLNKIIDRFGANKEPNDRSEENIFKQPFI